MTKYHGDYWRRLPRFHTTASTQLHVRKLILGLLCLLIAAFLVQRGCDLQDEDFKIVAAARRLKSDDGDGDDGDDKGNPDFDMDYCINEDGAWVAIPVELDSVKNSDDDLLERYWKDPPPYCEDVAHGSIGPTGSNPPPFFSPSMEWNETRPRPSPRPTRHPTEENPTQLPTVALESPTFESPSLSPQIPTQRPWNEPNSPTNPSPSQFFTRRPFQWNPISQPSGSQIQPSRTPTTGNQTEPSRTPTAPSSPNQMKPSGSPTLQNAGNQTNPSRTPTRKPIAWHSSSPTSTNQEQSPALPPPATSKPSADLVPTQRPVQGDSSGGPPLESPTLTVAHSYVPSLHPTPPFEDWNKTEDLVITQVSCALPSWDDDSEDGDLSEQHPGYRFLHHVRYQMAHSVNEGTNFTIVLDHKDHDGDDSRDHPKEEDRDDNKNRQNVTSDDKIESEDCYPGNDVFLFERLRHCNASLLQSEGDEIVWWLYTVSYTTNYSNLTHVQAEVQKSIEYAITSQEFYNELSIYFPRLVTVSLPGKEKEAILHHDVEDSADEATTDAALDGVTVQVWDPSRWIGLGIFLSTLITTVVLTRTAIHRRRKAQEHQEWGIGLANEADMNQFLCFDCVYDGNIVRTFDKSKLVYRDDDSIMLGGVVPQNYLIGHSGEAFDTTESPTDDSPSSGIATQRSDNQGALSGGFHEKLSNRTIEE